MKRRAFFYSLISVYLAANSTAFGQNKCEFNIVGTWKAEIAGQENAPIYRFGEDGTVKVLSSGSTEKEIASATYKLDYPKAPKAISFNTVKGGGIFTEGTISMQIVGYDDNSFTSTMADSKPTRWVKLDSSRYFMVLAGRSGVFHDRSGPVFPMLIKIDGQKTEIDAVGIYAAKGEPAFGTIPANAYKAFMKEPSNDSDVMLRLEITSGQYERGMKILRMWERRVREDALLYSDIFLDNVLLVKEITESLNQCGEKIKLYKLDWGLDDLISEFNTPSLASFLYFRELRRLNDSLHIRDEKFHGREMRQTSGH